MSFASALKISHLPEKPWQTGAVLRFLAAVIVSWALLGGLTTMVVRYFETPQNSSTAVFLIVAVLGFVSAVSALVMLFRPWANEDRLLFNLILLLACIYVGMMCAWLAQRLIHGKIELQNPVVAMLILFASFQGFALATVTFFLRKHSTGWLEGFGLKTHPGQALLTGIAVGILAFYPILELNQIFFHMFEKLTLHPQEQQAVEILRHTDGMLERVISGIATILLAPIGEEIIFRGILYPWAKRAYSQQIALWGTALLFGAIHLNLSSCIPLALFAVVLICLYEYTGNLLAPIAVHCIFNGINFFLLFYQQP